MNLIDLHVLVVDDEPDGREYIRELIQAFYPGLGNVHIAGNIHSAREILFLHKINILLLDIQLQEGTIFQLFENRTLPLDKALIFVTAHKEYAYEAIKMQPLDYLLKPIAPDEFLRCIEKSIDHLKEQQHYKAIVEKEDKEIVLSEAGKYHLIKLSQILYCMSMEVYTSFFLKNGQKILVSKPMIRFQKELEENHFFRIHKSYMVNMKYIRSVQNEGAMHVVLSNGENLPIARRRRPSFIRMFKQKI